MTVKRWGLRRRARRERGAVAVEAALLTPILVLLVFGIIEFSFLMRDHVAVSSAVRTGGRIASASADAGNAECETGPEAPPCAPASTPALAQVAADSIQRAGSAMPTDSIDYVLIYKANAQGYPGSDGSTTMPTSCTGIPDCVRFTWRDSADKFLYAGGAWNSTTINACVNESDALGVHMQAHHDYITGLFGSTIDVSDHAVMKFEPLKYEECKPGTHA